jgi:putative hemolysin
MLMPSDFEVRLAKDAEDLWAVQRLRYDVFVRELGASGPAVNHDLEIEADAFDAHSEHLMVLDRARGADLTEQLVGVYRMMTQAGAEAAGGFYTASEFDLAPLLQTGWPMMELGRSCLRKPYRGGAAMFYLWQALAQHVTDQGAEILFGTASFAGTDLCALTAPLSLLGREHLAQAALRPKAIGAGAVPLGASGDFEIDRLAALRAMPALIKAYLRLGGCVGEGAYVDAAFNTVDVCMVLNVPAMNPRQKTIYLKGSG